MKSRCYTLQELADIKYGKNQKKVESDTGTIPIYGTGGLMGYATEPIYDQPSVLIGRKGTIDKVHYVEHPFWTVDTLFYTKINTDIVLPRYFYYLMKQLDLKQYNEGTTIPSLRTETLNRLEFSIPDKAEQARRVSLIVPIENKIDYNTAINQNLVQQAQTIFLFCYNSARGKYPFTDRIHVLGGGTPKTGNSEFWNGNIPFFSPKDVGSPYVFQTEKYITESGLKHCNSRLYPLNTSFVTARGTVGKVSLAGRPMAMNQSCYALMSDEIDPLLVYFYTLMVVASLKHKATGAVFDAIITRDFETEYVSFLDDEASTRTLKLIKPLMDTVRLNAEENIRLGELRDTVLPHLMSGELDVSDIDI